MGWYHLFFAFYFILKYRWSKRCVSFSCTAKWLSYTYTCIYSFQILFPFRLLHNIEESSLCYTGGPCWLSIDILNAEGWIHQLKTPDLSLSPAPSLYSKPWVHSISLSLFLFSKSICIIFLDSAYKQYYMIFVGLCLTYFTPYNNFKVHLWHYLILLNGWVIFHCIQALHLLYPFTCQWTLRLLPLSWLL